MDINKNILIIDDNLTICLMLKSWLGQKGFSTETATNVEEAKRKVRDQPFDLILTDIRMPDADGFSFLSWVRKYDSDIIVIMMTGFADIESAVESMKSGAADYIPKPIEPEQLFKKIDEAFILQENLLKSGRVFDSFIQLPSKESRQIFKRLNHTAENNKHLLIMGGRGVGKESAVKYIYEKGIHLSKPLVVFDIEKTIDSGAPPDEPLVGSGTLSPLLHKFHEAKGGLLHIRQLGHLNIAMQNELVQILTKQERSEEFAQVIMTTDMTKGVLYDILIPKLYLLIEPDSVTLPSLKGKKALIIYLSSYFLQYANSILNKQIEAIDSVIQDKLVNHDWPGNIQELKNCIIKAASLTAGPKIPASIEPQLFAKEMSDIEDPLQFNPLKGLRKEHYEKEKIIEALELARGNKTMAASILNIDRKTLYNKIRLYNVPNHN